MLFSQRKGYKPASDTIQREGMNEELRNTLWNILDLYIRNKARGYEYFSIGQLIGKLSIVIWVDYFKKPIDTRPESDHEIIQDIRDYYFSCKWYEVYDLIEFILKFFNDNDLAEFINNMLDRELSAYRFIDNTLTDITDEQEIHMIDEALKDNDFPGVRKHLKRALELLSDRKSPDYRNSIKESISAVESLCQIVTGKPKATLGDALNVIGRKGKIHPALIEAFTRLYGYTSNEEGIRHAMSEEPDIGPSDAKFFLMSCTSFINYLKSKM